MIISIDGPDGVGKTTHCTLIIKTLKKFGHSAQYKLAISPESESTDIRSLIDIQTPPLCLKSRFLLYCGIIYEQNYRIFEKYATSSKQHIVMDRFVETLICSNVDKISEYEMDHYYKLANSIFQNFDKYIKISLTADLQTTINRINIRKNISIGDKFYMDNSKNIHEKFKTASKVGKVKVFNTENDQLSVSKNIIQFLESKILL